MTTITLEGKEYQLDIEQAKKLNLLKEKDNRVRSDVEFVKKYCGVCGYSYNITANMITRSETPIYTADQLTPYEAKAIAAFSKLLKVKIEALDSHKNTALNAFNEYCRKT